MQFNFLFVYDPKLSREYRTSLRLSLSPSQRSYPRHLKTRPINQWDFPLKLVIWDSIISSHKSLSTQPLGKLNLVLEVIKVFWLISCVGWCVFKAPPLNSNLKKVVRWIERLACILLYRDLGLYVDSKNPPGMNHSEGQSGSFSLWTLWWKYFEVVLMLFLDHIINM